MARLFVNASSEYLRSSATPVSGVPFTMACWFESGDNTNTRYLMGLGDSSQADEFYVLVAAGASGGDPIDFFRITTGTSDDVNTSTGYSAGTWHHACGVAAATNDIAVYLDGGGKQAGSTDVSISGWDNVSIGTSPDSTPSLHFDGSIAEAAVWNAALTDAEVASLATGLSPLLVRPGSLAAYWPLVRTLQDVAGGYDVSASGTAVAVHPPAVRYPVPLSVGLPAGGGCTQVTATVTVTIPITVTVTVTAQE
jgi:hypothetical protein